MAYLEVVDCYFPLAIARSWFVRSLCFKTHSHHLQAKIEWYCV